MLGTGLILFLALSFIFRNKAVGLRQFVTVYLFAFLGLALLVMGLTGRLHWLSIIIGGLMNAFVLLLSFSLKNPLRLIQSLMILKNLFRFKWPAGPKTQPGSQESPGEQRSQVKTRFLDMSLNHDSGELDGKVLTGEFEGRRLSELALSELLLLAKLCESDQESLNILGAYLDRYHPEWQSSDQSSDQSNSQSAPMGDNIDEAQALAILGLAPGASTDDIVKAHRQLIQKMHPDRGGSTYLAAQINEAKSLLLSLRN